MPSLADTQLEYCLGGNRARMNAKHEKPLHKANGKEEATSSNSC